MARWNKTIKLRHLITDDCSRESMTKCREGIMEVLQKEGLYRDQTKTILERMEEAIELEEIDYFNLALERLWDFFDDHRIFVEF